MVLENGHCTEEVRVQLYEARAGDPAVPQGKAFAMISSEELGLPHHDEASCAIPHHPCLIRHKSFEDMAILFPVIDVLFAA